ncbi:dihydroorotate dehydrogenase electron transfer subunit [Pararhodobacter sp.]|uniref:dihydroorotate dehydrogenase electron transfer subunit n=1 Tax=Pararhodobacter sp. TaxID=2127056 RepID=UPI002AFEAC4D|nr:dihydroorotate dehydrogenase electron transfer subunit [Pararhodobacter sp.]
MTATCPAPTAAPDPAPAAAFPIADTACRVVSNEPVNAEYRLLLAEAGPTALTAEAGQFFQLKCPPTTQDHPFLRRPMSVYRIDRQNGQIGFLYKVTGKGTRGLSTLVPGDRLEAIGPLGLGFTLPAGTKHVLLVARGVGLATLTPLVQMARAAGAEVTAILSARNPAMVMSRDELAAQGARVIEVTDTAGDSDMAQVEALLRRLHAEQPFDFAATCGSNRLLQLTKALSAEWQIAGQAAMEAFMGCGMGMCYACVLPVTAPSGETIFKRVCREGPVFSIEEVQSW